MTLAKLWKAPFPYFGGKTDAAPAVWAALGDVAHYVEPFAGSLAVLLLRPHQCNRTYHSETVNDLEGLLCNAWRSIALSPDETAQAASWPVCEADLHARHLALVRWRAETPLERLMGDPTWHDPVMAGFWIWGACCWIGGGWCAGDGPWIADTNGIFHKQARARAGDAARESGVSRKRPHLGDNGQGVNRPQARELGVIRKLPHISNNGRGVNHAETREPGVSRKRPHLGHNGLGVNRPQAREPGVSRKRPHISDNGRGVNHAETREPGVSHDADLCTLDTEYHPMLMPELRRWIQFLSARLRHVRILNGDWARACTHGATHMLAVRKNGGACGVFLDPPYSASVRKNGIYTSDQSGVDVTADVRAWCVANGGNPKLRIVLAGFDGEHDMLSDEHGWRVVEWYRSGFLKGGMGNTKRDGSGSQQHRERLWLSPHCLTTEETPCE